MFWGRSDRFTVLRRKRSKTNPIRAAAESLEQRTLLSANTLTVMNLSATGAGSLDQAILDANASGVKTTINFAAGLSGVLNVPAPLPNFTTYIILDGPGESVLSLTGETGTGLGAAAGVTAEIENLNIGGNGESLDNFGNLTLANCFVGNAFNGGITNELNASLTMDDCIVSEITNLDSNAIGVDNLGTASLINSSIVDNGGDGVDNSGTLAVTNCTLTGNDSASSNGIENSGTMTITDSTIDQNTTGISSTSTFVLNGSIVADDDTDLILTTSGISGAHDLIGDGSDGGALSDSQRGTADDPIDPLLDPPVNNGGDTLTQALQAGSAAIGNGADFPVQDSSGNDITAADQRGAARPQDGAYDIGAYQTVPNSGLAPVITSASETTFLSGLPNSFTVVATGTPTATLQLRGILPPGVTFVDNGDGTGTLSGTPVVPVAGVDSIAFRAKNGISPVDRQVFELTVDLSKSPVLRGEQKSTFVVGNDKLVELSAVGTPTPRITETGSLPAGVTFTALNNGSATIEGNATPGSGGVYVLNLKAANGVAPAVRKTYTLTIAQDVSITSSAATAFTAGTFGVFKVQTSGYPAAALKEVGALPPGVTFKDLGNGAGKLRGTPAAGSAGVYDIKIKASNGFPTVKQSFVLTILDPAPAIAARIES